MLRVTTSTKILYLTIHSTKWVHLSTFARHLNFHSEAVVFNSLRLFADQLIEILLVRRFLFFFFFLKIFFYSKKEIFIKEEICYLGFWLNTWISNWYKIWNRPWRKQVKRRRLVSSCTWRWPSSDYRLIWTRSSAVWIRWNRSGRRTATLQLRRTARWSRSARSRQCTTRCLVYPTRRRRGSPSETWTGRPLPLSSAGPSWRSTSWPDCVIDELSDRRRTLPIKRHCFLLFFFFYSFLKKKTNTASALGV